MSQKPQGEARNTKPICTWLPEVDYEAFVLVAAMHGVSPAAYLRAIVVDVLADEAERRQKVAAAR